jgi:hypothetical protein
MIDALLPLPFNIAVVFAIRKVWKNQVGLKLNGTHQLLLFADNMNLLGHNKQPEAASELYQHRYHK